MVQSSDSQQKDDENEDMNVPGKVQKMQDAGLISDVQDLSSLEKDNIESNEEEEENKEQEGEQEKKEGSEDDSEDLFSLVDDSLLELSHEVDEIDADEIMQKLERSHTQLETDKKLPDEVKSAWEDAIREIVKEDGINEMPESIGPEKISFLQKIQDLFTRSDHTVEGYSSVKHGPLVNFALPEGTNYKEIDNYEIDPPYSYIRIVHDSDLHEYQYQVIEPELSEKEKELLESIKVRLVETLDVNLRDITKANAKEYLREHVNIFLRDYRIELSPVNHEKVMYYIVRDFLGYGEIDALMKDKGIEDISCDGPNTPIFAYHRKYESIPTNIIIETDEELDSFIIRIAQICGKHISIANPLLDATMPDGSRIQLTLGREVTTRGSTFTIRRFNENPITPYDLVGYHTFSTAMMAYLWLAVESSKSIIFSGGTASGKTTAMNAISMYIQPEMKIVSIEDTRELNLAHPNWIPGVTREAFAGEDRGSIQMYELLRASLRQRPEYILVGEVRGAEAYVLFQAMSTGHTTFSTIHADSVQSIVHRLENPPINVPRIMIQALDIVAVQAQVKVGDERVRRCKSLTEIVGVDPRTGELLTNEVFTWSAANDQFQYSGRSYVIESVMENTGWDEARVREELQQRQDVLEWTLLKSIDDYNDFSKIVVAYKREPETIMKLVRQDLHD
ncbi:MAG: type II/IV secretion system ATPase subunit [Euryarchaeota archaeon]|nr:type II/IV secretion system ATPase subunit [Euryarchaeota archaeon]